MRKQPEYETPRADFLGRYISQDVGGVWNGDDDYMPGRVVVMSIASPCCASKVTTDQGFTSEFSFKVRCVSLL